MSKNRIKVPVRLLQRVLDRAQELVVLHHDIQNGEVWHRALNDLERALEDFGDKVPNDSIPGTLLCDPERNLK